MDDLLCDKRLVAEHIVAAPDPQGDQILAIALLNLAQTSRHHFTSSVDQENVMAKLLCCLHQMRGEDYRFISRLEFSNNIDQELYIYRIEPGEWFVQYQQIGIVQHGRNELDLLLHSLR